ncbi:MAG: DUF5794 domain-containing protein, partial [Candidatus Nanohaloarchaea archaeon]
ARRMVLQAAPVLLVGVFVVALVAPVFADVFAVSRLRLAAGLALLVIAGQLADIDLADRFTVPAVILTGLVVSINQPGALAVSFRYVLPALAAATVALLGLYGAASLHTDRLDLRYIRSGGAVVLCTIALSQFGLHVPSELGLAVFALSVA